jgi:hypothetical protein
MPPGFSGDCLRAPFTDLIDAGQLRVFVEDVFPLAQASAAYARAQRGNMRGKIALTLMPPNASIADSPILAK